jgi:hypothetical protein
MKILKKAEGKDCPYKAEDTRSSMSKIHTAETKNLRYEFEYII